MGLFTSSNQHIISAKREARQKAVENAGSAPDVADVATFTSATATEIVARIEKGEWTASQVIEAFIARAVFAHATTNCLTEVMFDWAREQAKDLDKEFAATKKLRGPMHGVPVSFKDQFQIKGYDATIGFSSWANNASKENADLVNQFLEAGAILFVKTNVPQTMFAFECSNPLWGRTTNPYSDKHTCGGSSGGEGALLAMDGSALGVGTDIGGSLRIPTVYCGIYSLKPAAGRVSFYGSLGPVPGFEGIKTVAGPMARSIGDLELFAKVAFGQQANDPQVAPIPFREVTLPQKLKFGYYTSDGFIKASPACQRAVQETVEALRKQGHECVEIPMKEAVTRSFKIFVGLTSADGYKKMMSHISPDPSEKSLQLVSIAPKLFSWMRTMLAWSFETFFGDKIFADGLRQARVKTVGEYTSIVAERQDFVHWFHQAVWNEHKIDGIIAPVQGLPQLPHGGCDNHSSIAASTILYNMLDHAAGCIPVTRVDPNLDALTDEWREGPGHGSTMLERDIYGGKNPFYDPVAMKGMPVGIQIIGKKWEEEKVLAMMRVVDEAIGGKTRGFGPGAWTRFNEKKDA